jgi:hypothetical protein
VHVSLNCGGATKQRRHTTLIAFGRETEKARELFQNANEYNTNGVSIDPASPHGEWEAEIGVGKLRLNGLVSLDAAYTSVSNASILTTKPLIFSGSKLLLNLNAGGGGSLYIELHLGSHASGPSLLTSNFLTHNGVDLEAAFHSSANASASTNKVILDPCGTCVSLLPPGSHPSDFCCCEDGDRGAGRTTDCFGDAHARLQTLRVPVRGVAFWCIVRVSAFVRHALLSALLNAIAVVVFIHRL